MKKTKVLNNEELAGFCGQLALLLPAGITPYEAISLMYEDTQSAQGRLLLDQLTASLKDGLTFHEALVASALFPDYVISMVELGEVSGNLDVILQKLADYYEQQCAISDSIKNAVSYPLIMVVLMLFILIVLLTKILPIFQQVFLQLGSGLTGVAGQLMSLGNLLQSSGLILLLLFLFLFIAAVLFTRSTKGKAAFEHFLHNNKLTRNFFLGIAYSRFASSLSMITASGMDTFQGLILAQKLIANTCMSQKLEQCRKSLLQGESLPDAMKTAGIFQAKHLRMLQLGYRSGNTDTVLQRIASYYEDDTQNRIQRILGAVEPTLVIVFSLLVGLILLSVILPLIGIMSHIG